MRPAQKPRVDAVAKVREPCGHYVENAEYEDDRQAEADDQPHYRIGDELAGEGHASISAWSRG